MPHLNLAIEAGGPIIIVHIAPSAPRQRLFARAGQAVPLPLRARALVDTGASCTCVDTSIVQRLQLQSTGATAIHTPSTGATPHLCRQYDVQIIIQHPEFSRFWHAVPVIESALAYQGIEALIGRDILSDCLFVYDGRAGQHLIAF